MNQLQVHCIVTLILTRILWMLGIGETAAGSSWHEEPVLENMNNSTTKTGRLHHCEYYIQGSQICRQTVQNNPTLIQLLKTILLSSNCSTSMCLLLLYAKNSLYDRVHFNLKLWVGLYMALSRPQSLWHQSAVSCENLSTMTAARPGWVTRTRMRSVTVHSLQLVSGCITNFPPFICIQDWPNSQLSIRSQKT